MHEELHEEFLEDKDERNLALRLFINVKNYYLTLL